MTTSQPTRMRDEIGQQPEALARTLDALLPLRPDISRIGQQRRRVLFMARGSSDNAAVYGRYLLESHAGVSAALGAPSLATHYKVITDLSDAIVVGVSQSGETTEIVEAQQWARSMGAVTIAVTNNEGSPLADQADLALVTRAGTERAVPATKTYVTQLAAMTVLATALAPEPSMLDADIARIPDEVARLIEQTSPDEAVALLQAGSAIVSGRGLMLGTALEVALKMEETCLRPVRGYSYADLRHGPISVVDEGMTAVLLSAGDGPMVAAMGDLADDLRHRGARIVGFGGDAGFATRCDVRVAGPDLPEALAPLAAIVPPQLVIEQLCRELGLDPDAPRGLRKVTSTEV